MLPILSLAATPPRAARPEGCGLVSHRCTRGAAWCARCAPGAAGKIVGVGKAAELSELDLHGVMCSQQAGRITKRKDML